MHVFEGATPILLRENQLHKESGSQEENAKVEL
jgi:hypothetical protein